MAQPVVPPIPPPQGPAIGRAGATVARSAPRREAREPIAGYAAVPHRPVGPRSWPAMLIDVHIGQNGSPPGAVAGPIVRRPALAAMPPVPFVSRPGG